MAFASDTCVPVHRSRGEIEDLIRRAGGRKFASMFDENRAVVLFEVHDRQIKFELELPTRESFATEEYLYHRGGVARTKTRALSPGLQERKWEQACRSRWRALALCIKAKLVSRPRQTPQGIRLNPRS